MYTKETQQTKTAAKDATADLQEDIRLIKEKARETRDAISQTAHDAKDVAHDVLSKSLQEARDKTHDAREKLVDYFNANPVKSVLAAGLAGLLIAKLIRG